MRKFWETASVTAAGLGLAISMSATAAPDEPAPEARAYFNFSFGGDTPAPRRLHYGLKLDREQSFVPADQTRAALMQLDFSRRGLSAISVNGLNVLRPKYRVNQDEEIEDEAIEEEEGFFDGIVSWFGGLFGDDEDEAVAEGEGADAADDEASAETETAAVDDEAYDAIDWGLLAVGVAGIGFVTSELIDGEDDRKPRAGAGGAGAGGGGGGGGTPGLPCPPAPVPRPPGCTPFAGGPAGLPGSAAVSPEYRGWLDGGTGQMGDLRPRD